MDMEIEIDCGGSYSSFEVNSSSSFSSTGRTKRRKKTSALTEGEKKIADRFFLNGDENSNENL